MKLFELKDTSAENPASGTILYDTTADLAYEFTGGAYVPYIMLATPEAALVPPTFETGSVMYLTSDHTNPADGQIFFMTDLSAVFTYDLATTDYLEPTFTSVADNTAILELTGMVAGDYAYDEALSELYVYTTDWTTEVVEGVLIANYKDVEILPAISSLLEGLIVSGVSSWTQLAETGAEITVITSAPSLEDKRIIAADSLADAQVIYNSIYGKDADTTAEMNADDYILGVPESNIVGNHVKGLCSCCGGSNIIESIMFKDLDGNAIQKTFYKVTCLSCNKTYIALVIG